MSQSQPTSESQTILYFKTAYPLHHQAKKWIRLFMHMICYIPSLYTELFLRRRFGERYFPLWIPFLFAVFVLIIVSTTTYLTSFFRPGDFYGWQVSSGLYSYIWTGSGSWLLFIIAVLVMTIIQRHIMRSLPPQTFDATRFSLYSGDQLKFWSKIERHLPQPYLEYNMQWHIERYYEGGLTIIIGGITCLFGQTFTGSFLIICGLCYIIRVRIQYATSRDFILDKIDKQIFNRNLYDALVNDATEPHRGFRWSGYKPQDPELRKEVAKNLFTDEDEAATVY